jgi:anti-sigma B factor antagonist
MTDTRTASASGDVAFSLEPSVTGIRLTGAIDFALDRDLRIVARTALDRQLPVRVDLSAVTFLDSTGLGFVARLLHDENLARRRLTAVGASTMTRDRLELAGLDRLMTFED